MSSTKYKYILIFINVIVIVLSISVLVYVHQTENDNLIENTLIAVALLAYCLCIIGSIGVGLENICLLAFYAVVLTIPLIGSCTFLVYNTLSSLLQDEQQLITFVRSLLLAIIVITSIQVLSSYYLIYQIIMERRINRLNQYRLTTALSIDDL
jgi:hypothetical protein